MRKQPITVLKLGGSVVTRKDARGIHFRRSLIRRIGRSLARHIDKTGNRLVLLHGAGAPGHRLAQRYDLASGVQGNTNRREGALRSQIINQELHLIVMTALRESGLPVVTVQPSSVIRQLNGRISSIFMPPIRHALKFNLVPVLFGDLVPDETLEFSICSADASGAYLARALAAERLLFSTDVDGIYTRDPHRHRNARLIRKASLHSLLEGTAHLSVSHSRDVTAGMAGKLQTVASYLKGGQTDKVVIFNGLVPTRYDQTLAETPGPRTTIEVKKSG